MALAKNSGASNPVDHQSGFGFSSGSAFGPFALGSFTGPRSGQPNGRIDVQRRGHLIG